MEEGVSEAGEAAAGVDVAGEGVEEVEEDRLGDGAQGFGGRAEVGEVLDVFDLALRLADAQRAEAARLEEEDMEISRLSLMASPYKSPAGKGGRVGGERRRKRAVWSWMAVAASSWGISPMRG